MRVEFAQAIIKEFEKKDALVFLTGDLGFMALESVQEKLGDHFINSGIAEQNMVTMAASLAYEQFIPFVYSISPFVTLRPYEQIRNDVCLHQLPVKIVGNGGGYGYGIMGSTHHNIEDIGAMRLLPHMQVYVPVTSADVFDAVAQMVKDPNPNYLRLNMAASLGEVGVFAPWRKFKSGNRLIVISVGPVVENIYKLPSELLDSIEIWSVGILPITEIPNELLERINEVQNVLTIEEHAGECGLQETIACHLLKKLNIPIHFQSIYAKGYLSGTYGNQTFHQSENDLAGEGLEAQIVNALNH
jgi:transketolase